MSTEILTQYAQKHIGAFIGCAVGFLSAGAVYANLTAEVTRNATAIVKYEAIIHQQATTLVRIETHLEWIRKQLEKQKP